DVMGVGGRGLVTTGDGRGLAPNGQWLSLVAQWHWPQTTNSAARLSGKRLAFWQSLYVLAKLLSQTPSTASSTLAWPSASTPRSSTKSCARSLLHDRPVQHLVQKEK